MLTPSIAFASEQVTQSPVKDKVYSNPSKIQNVNSLSDTANLEYLIVNGANALKATSNEKATQEKPKILQKRWYFPLIQAIGS